MIDPPGAVGVITIWSSDFDKFQYLHLISRLAIVID